jgi:ABC-type uncharacterized transport system involved in gliding motility auxiliary subunit
MRANRQLRTQLRIQSVLFSVLFLVLVMLLAFLARDYRKEWDVTVTARNTLSQPMLDLLGRLQGPVTFTAYALKRDIAGTNVHKLIEEHMRRYQSAKPDIALRIIDPREEPKQAEAAGIRAENELVIEYRKRVEHLPLGELGNEQSVANALMRLARGSESLILALEGHGERRLDGPAANDLAKFGRYLQQNGFRLNTLSLVLAQDVPANASLLVIASPQIDVQAAEVEKIQRYVRSGGNILWLIDPGPLHGLDPLAETLGLVLTPGTIVDLASPRPNGPPVFATATPGSSGRHAVTAALRYNTTFPYARQIDTAESEDWQITPLIEVAQRGWVEVGKLDDQPTFDAAHDLRGPVNIAAAFQRAVGDRQQRVLVVGCGSFLSNTYLGNGGNLQLGMAMVNWLASEDDLVSIDPRPAADSRIEIDQMRLYATALFFLLVLPFAFALSGVIVWWRRRNAT